MKKAELWIAIAGSAIFAGFYFKAKADLKDCKRNVALWRGRAIARGLR